MYDHGSEDRHTTLIAGLILVILLAAVAAFASPVAAEEWSHLQKSENADYLVCQPLTSGRTAAADHAETYDRRPAYDPITAGHHRCAEDVCRFSVQRETCGCIDDGVADDELVAPSC